MSDKTKLNSGFIINKFHVTRTDGQSAPGNKHSNCSYFVLDLNHDSYALPALEAYAIACKDDYPFLADDLEALVKGKKFI